MSFFNSIEELYQYELYDEIVYLDELIPPVFRDITCHNEGLLSFYLAEAYNELGKYSLSRYYYKQADKLYPKFTKSLPHNEVSQCEIQFRYHKSLVKMKKFEEAIEILKKMDSDDAPPKVKFALIKLQLERDGLDSIYSHLPYYKSIVEQCPSALMSLSMLTRYGEEKTISIPMKGNRIVDTWLEAQLYQGKGFHDKTAELLASIEVASYRYSIEAALIAYKKGNEEQAMTFFDIAQNLFPYRSTHMDLYAYLLYENKADIKILEALAQRMMEEDPDSVETQIVIGYLCRSLGPTNHSKALHIATNACLTSTFVNRPTPHALILKAGLLLDMDKLDDATRISHEGMKCYQNCFELHKIFTNCLVSKNSMRDARASAAAFIHNNPNDFRGDTVKASVLLKTSANSNKQEGQRLLENTIKRHPQYLPAVWLLIDYYSTVQKNEEGKQLLERLSKLSFSQQTLSRLHHHLAEFNQKLNKSEAAYENLTIALATGRTEALIEIPTLEVAMSTNPYQTPSPLAPIARPPLPQAPRRRAPRNSDDVSPMSGVRE